MIAFYQKLPAAEVANSGDTQPPFEIHPPQRWHSNHPNQRSRADLLAASRSGSPFRRCDSLIRGSAPGRFCTGRPGHHPSDRRPQALAARGGHHRPTPPGGGFRIPSSESFWSSSRPPQFGDYAGGCFCDALHAQRYGVTACEKSGCEFRESFRSVA